MKVLHVCTSDTGGAFQAAYNLHLGLQGLGVESKMLVLYKYRKLSETSSFLENRNIIEQIRDSISSRIFSFKKRKKTAEFNSIFSFARSPYNVLRHPDVKQADVINLHWTSGFLDFPTFFSHVNKPVFWTLHDMHPFSGGFHYKSLQELAMERLIAQNIRIKVKSIQNIKSKVTIVSPSKWLMEVSKASQPFITLPHYHIPYVVNHNYFQYKESSIARKTLKIFTQKKVILFIADNLNDKRKGLSIFLESLKLLDPNNIFLMIVGSGQITLPNESLEFKHFGYVDNLDQLSLIYSAADLFVIPSMEDNFPNTIIESLCCGTPVVGFDIGGCEAIINEVNGMVSFDISKEGLAETINSSLSQPFHRRNIAIQSQEEYGLSIQAEKYLKQYADSLD